MFIELKLILKIKLTNHNKLINELITIKLIPNSFSYLS